MNNHENNHENNHDIFDDDVSYEGTDIFSAFQDAVKAQRLLEQQIEQVSAQLNTLQDNLKHVQRNVIPTLMERMEMTRYVGDKYEVSVKHNLRGYVLKQRQEAAIKWLEEHGAGDLINREFTVRFKRTEKETAQNVRTWLEEHGYNFSATANIHWKTLANMCLDLIKRGEIPPPDLIHIDEWDESIIKEGEQS